MTMLTYEFFLRVAGNLVHFEGRPGLLLRYSPSMGDGGTYTPTQTFLGLRQAFPPFVHGGLRDKPKERLRGRVGGARLSTDQFETSA